MSQVGKSLTNKLQAADIRLEKWDVIGRKKCKANNDFEEAY